MGQAILCHRKKAVRPYYIERADVSVYTIEELCYYLFHNLYLADRSLMNDKLCDWLEKELELQQLADKLRREVNFGLAVQDFILPIFNEISYCTPVELEEIKARLRIYKRQTETERKKYRADHLLQNGRFGAALQEYYGILTDKKDEKLKTEFLGQIYHNIGTAYARLFRFEKAARMYLTAYEYMQDDAMLQLYVYASSMYMSAEELEQMLEEDESNRMLYDKISAAAAEKEKIIRSELADQTEKNKEFRLAGIRKKYEKSILV